MDKMEMLQRVHPLFIKALRLPFARTREYDDDDS